MSTLSVAFSKIQASQLDGLAQSFRYKQAALQHLYNALIVAATKIKTSIQADWLLSSSEVDFEFSQSLSELRSLYESLELQKELNSIHQVEKGVQNAERTRPLSVVYIKPSKWSLFYSVISPLSSAIAAGCCTVVEASVLNPVSNSEADFVASIAAPDVDKDFSSSERSLVQSLEC